MPTRSAAAESGVRVDGMRDLLRAVSRMPKDLEREIKDASKLIALEAVADIRRSANTPAERKAAASVRARAGRDPRIAAGGTGSASGLMFWGTEFGGGRRPTTRQFRPWSGTRGYWFYPTVRARGRKWAELWLEGIDDTIRRHWRNNT